MADFYAPKLVDIEADASKNQFIICNDDLENNQAVKEMNALLKLSDEPIDKEAIANVNMERMKNLKMEEFAKDLEEAKKE